MSDPSRPPPLDRRHFLKVVGGGAAAGTLPVAAAAQMQHGATAHGAAHPPHAPAPASASPPASVSAWQFFNTDEAAFMEAAVDALIPADETGPGALEAGVATYIDRQMGLVIACTALALTARARRTA